MRQVLKNGEGSYKGCKLKKIVKEKMVEIKMLKEFVLNFDGTTISGAKRKLFVDKEYFMLEIEVEGDKIKGDDVFDENDQNSDEDVDGVDKKTKE